MSEVFSQHQTSSLKVVEVPNGFASWVRYCDFFSQKVEHISSYHRSAQEIEAYKIATQVIRLLEENDVYTAVEIFERMPHYSHTIH